MFLCCRQKVLDDIKRDREARAAAQVCLERSCLFISNEGITLIA